MMVQRDENPEAAQSGAGDGARSAPASFVRIGELSRRTGVRAETIRAWERRYGLIEPARSAGGFRLYSPADEERLHAMRALIAEGVAAAEAATQARSGGGAAVPSVRSPDAEADRLRAALEAYDEEAANAVLDRALSAFSLDVFTGAVVLPAMAEIGNRWAGGEASVAQEHFATSVVRGRLLAISRGWGSGRGPLALLACPPGEQHDIGLIAFGLSLRNRGWRIVYLGQDTPLDTLAETVAAARPCPRRAQRRGRRVSRVSRSRARRGCGFGPRVDWRPGGQRGDGAPGRRGVPRGAPDRGRGASGCGRYFRLEARRNATIGRPPWS